MTSCPLGCPSGGENIQSAIQGTNRNPLQLHTASLWLWQRGSSPSFLLAPIFCPALLQYYIMQKLFCSFIRGWIKSLEHVNSRIAPLMLQCYRPETCSCIYLTGRHTVLRQHAGLVAKMQCWSGHSLILNYSQNVMSNPQMKREGSVAYYCRNRDAAAEFNASMLWSSKSYFCSFSAFNGGQCERLSTHKGCPILSAIFLLWHIGYRLQYFMICEIIYHMTHTHTLPCCWVITLLTRSDSR